MKYLFPLLKNRFDGDKQLVKVARVLFEGFEGSPQRSGNPYVEVTQTGTEDVGTFDADIDIVTLQFTAFAKGPRTDVIHDIMFELRRVFQNSGGYSSSEFDVVGFERTDQSGPKFEQGFLTASMTFRVYLHWKKTRPSERAA